jgi:hypothetical protein
MIMIGHGRDAWLLLERFQTGLVGLIGFAGVIITLFVNARIARGQAREGREHDRRQMREAQDYERGALARALLAELSSYECSVKRNVDIMTRHSDTETGELLIPRTTTPVFDASIPRLCILVIKQLGPVLEAYLTVKEIDRSLSLFSASGGNGHYWVIKVPRVRNVEQMFESLLQPFNAAIAALTPHRA